MSETDAAARRVAEIVESSRQQHDLSINVFRLERNISAALSTARAEGYAAGKADGLREAAGSSGAALIAAERRRQIEVEGYKPEHDARHDNGDLVRAAIAYLIHAMGSYHHGAWWPWSDEYWKPKDRRANLIRAGALIAAELDRLAALAAPAGETAAPATAGTDRAASGEVGDDH